MFKISELWTCDMNSTLGSVVPLAMFFIHPLLVLNLQGFEVKLARKLIPSITKLFIPSQLLVILVFLFSILQMPIPGWPLMAGFLCASWGDLWQDGSPHHFAAHAHPPWWAALALQCWKWRWSWHKFSTGSNVPLSGIAVEAQSPPYSSFTAAHIWLISCQVKPPLSMLKTQNKAAHIIILGWRQFIPSCICRPRSLLTLFSSPSSSSRWPRRRR